MNDEICALMPLDHIKHVLEPYTHNCRLCRDPKLDVSSRHCWYTASDDGRRGGWGRHKTDVMRDWAQKGRKRGNMMENGARIGFEAWMGFAFLAQGLNLRNSPKHFNGEAEFLPGWSATTENYSQKWNLVCYFDFFLVTGRVTGYSFKTFI